nr:hypothetical protein [Tanacetum cinerariifolium]
MLGADEARQDPNIMTGTFTLNNHYATTLFDSGVDYSFVFTTFIPLLSIKPNELGFSYEIEIASGQLVEIDKVIKGCKLEIEKQEELIMVRDFPEVFLDDLSGLPPSQEIKFHIELVPGAIPVMKSPYQLAPSKMEELSGQLKELHDKDPSKIEAVKNRKAPRTLSEVHLFLGLTGYYRRFIENFSKIVKPLTVLTQKTLSDGPEDFVVYCDAFGLGLGCELMQGGVDKMYYELKDRYWCPGMKKDIAVYEEIAMDFVTKLPRTSSGHDTIWVIMDRLTKSAHFLPMREDYKMDRLARLYLNEIVARHGVPILIISDRDSRFTSRFWQLMQEALGTQLDMSTDHHPQTDSQSMVRFWKKRKLAPRFVGPFEIIEKVGHVAYILRLLEELNGVHDTFHVSHLKKRLADPILQVPLDEI